MYFAKHTQQEVTTFVYPTVQDVYNMVERMEWEDCEWALYEATGGADFKAEFPCTYSFHYGEEHYTCEHTANRPDSYCEVHSA